MQADPVARPAADRAAAWSGAAACSHACSSSPAASTARRSRAASSAWAGDDGNYWGHNAILRIEAFAGCCGLPELPGRKPFGGHILSHDFVEAALMRRAGWKVRMADEVGGSYEESPPSLIDLAIRDRRWAQGNLQHVKVLGARGLRWHSRMHFAFGIMSYLSSPLWLMLLLLGFALSVQASLHDPEYFSDAVPAVPRLAAVRRRAHAGAVRASASSCCSCRRSLGFLRRCCRAACAAALGTLELLASTLLELLLSALYAPVLMLLQSRYVLEILTGRDAGWASAAPRGRPRSAGAKPGGSTGATRSPACCSARCSRCSRRRCCRGSRRCSPACCCRCRCRTGAAAIGIGRALARVGILCTPEEVHVPAIVRRRDELIARSPRAAGGRPARARHGCRGGASSTCRPNLPPPAPVRGAPEAERLTAEQKLRDAQSLDEALGWLTPRERVYVAADAMMLERLAALAGSPA